MASTVIFWTTEIAPFNLNGNGVLIVPEPCELLGGRTGYYLALDKKEIIEAKGATVEEISINDIKIKSH